MIKRTLKKFLSIRASIITLVIIILALSSSFSIYLFATMSYKTIEKSALSQFDRQAEDIRNFLENIDKFVVNSVTIASNYKQETTDTRNEKQNLFRLYTSLISNQSYIYSIYTADKDSYFSVINLNALDSLRKKYDAHSEDDWVTLDIIKKEGKKQVITSYYDSNLNIRTSTIDPFKSNYTNRSWYINAKVEHVYKTRPYLFQAIRGEQLPGITYSRLSNKTGKVTSIDVLYNSINDFISHQNDLEYNIPTTLFLYENKGRILASNTPRHWDEVPLPKSKPLSLAQEQKQYIEQNPYINISLEDDWPPLLYTESGNPSGYALDILKIITDMTGLKFTFIKGDNWEHITQQFINKDLDVLFPIFNHKKNRTLGSITNKVLDFPIAVATSLFSEDITDLSQLEGKTVAVPSGWTLINTIKQDYPNIKLKITPTALRALFTVDSGEADAAIGSEYVMSYNMIQYDLEDNLILHRDLSSKIKNLDPNLYMLTQKEDHILNRILNKAIKNITQEQLLTLNSKWILENENKAENFTSYKTLVKYAELKGTEGKLAQEQIKGKNYFLHVSPTDKNLALKHKDDNAEFIAIIATEDNILGEQKHEIQKIILLNIALICLVIPIAWYLSHPIVKPIQLITKISQLIGQYKYKEAKGIIVKTDIQECNHLYKMIINMSESLQLYEKNQQEFIDSVIQMIAQSIDDKSKYTAGHCERVPLLALELMDKIHHANHGVFKSFQFENEDEQREFRIAAWMHDCGKLVTPEYIVDKGSKLETVYNRIHEIRTRFEILRRDAQIKYLEQCLITPEKEPQYKTEFEEQCQQLNDDFKFIAQCNIGGESMKEEDIERIKQISDIKWTRHYSDRLGLSPEEETNLSDDNKEKTLPCEENLLSDKQEHIVKRRSEKSDYSDLNVKMDIPENEINRGEVYNLTIPWGTLSPEERYRINEHVIITLKMLSQLPFPPELARVPKYASTHHETMIGTGYPLKLTKEELSIPERVMALADVFEALTAADRPYKKAKTLSESIRILSSMAKKQHIDEDVFHFFLESGVYLSFAKQFMHPEQIDHVDLSLYGITP